MSSRIISHGVIDHALGRQRTKFNVRTDAPGKLRRTLDGRVYASAAERDHAAKLELLRKCGKITAWQPQVPFNLWVNGRVIGTHVVDFLIYDKAEGERVEEVKGHQTELWKWKRKHFEAQYPEIPYIVISAAGLARRTR